MEFGTRELIQFATLFASLAGAFAVVKLQVSRIIQDLKILEHYVDKIESRLEILESSQAVIRHQVKVFADILSPSNLKDLNKTLTELQTEMKATNKNIDKLYGMHNGKHPPVGVA
jgi:septal ring factor EnvC (AmiA/AmiB activator)|tara:strand:- start:711 stop:1055 length:345 start_codon:yes stop_codon:yes gene_type:complete